MGVKQRQGVEQAVVGSERQHAAGIACGQAHIALRQRYHFRPRRRARRQQNEGVIVAARGAARAGGPDCRADERAAAEIVVRPRHEIDHRDIEHLGNVTTW